MTAYYNEIDPYAARWLRNLIQAELIAPGDVDERDIKDVRPNDLTGYTQCHFFAGIGGWSYALRLAGWPDDRPVWTGSCPCQPYSVANTEATGQDDERHLWPDFSELICKRKPSVVFGEQVASAIRWGWLDSAFRDLEADDYACAAAVMPGFVSKARHERERLYWVAHTNGPGRGGHKQYLRTLERTEKTRAVNGDPLASAWHILDGDHSSLLPVDGVSVTVERCATKGYGNAIIPQAAAEFISAYMEIV